MEEVVEQKNYSSDLDCGMNHDESQCERKEALEGPRHWWCVCVWVTGCWPRPFLYFIEAKTKQVCFLIITTQSMDGWMDGWLERK